MSVLYLIFDTIKQMDYSFILEDIFGQNNKMTLEKLYWKLNTEYLFL